MLNNGNQINNLRGPAAGPSSAATVAEQEKTNTLPGGPGDQAPGAGSSGSQTKNNKPKEQPEISLKTMADEDIKKMKKEPLKDLCKKEGLLYSGTVASLIKRLFLKKYGHTDRYICMMTKCGVCHASVKVTSTKKIARKDGSIVIMRQLKCSGKHKHTFSKTEIIPAPKKD